MRFIAIKASIQIRCKDMEKCGNGKIVGLSVPMCDACSYFDVCVICLFRGFYVVKKFD